MAIEGSVLVTRPLGQGEGLVEALQNNGLQTAYQPLIDIVALPELIPAQRRHLLELDSYQHLIFVSTNAVHFGLEQIANYWPQWPLSPRWHGIGPSTAAALSKNGLAVDSAADDSAHTSAMNSEELAERLSPGLQPGDKVLIIRGIGGRPWLAEQLTARGASVEYLEVYERRLPQLSAGQLAATISREHVSLIALSSGQALEHLRALLSEQEWVSVCQLGALVAGERNASSARRCGFKEVVVARNPTDEAMVKAALGWKSNRDFNSTK